MKIKAKRASTTHALNEADNNDTWEDAFALDHDTQEELARYDHVARYDSFTCFLQEGV